MGREQDECGNHSHGHLPPEEFRALGEPLANRLAGAVRAAARQLRGEPGYAGSALAEVEVWPRVPDLDMDVMAVVVPKPSGPGRLLLMYAWDWLQAHDDAALADSLVAQLRQAAAEGAVAEAEPGAAPDTAG